MLNEHKFSGKFQFLKFRIRDFMLNIFIFTLEKLKNKSISYLLSYIYF